jgi:topoisomerase-4 subunit B
VGKRNTGTRVRFWPDPKYFDTPKFNLRAIKHILRAKAVLCPGLRVTLFDEASGERAEWYYEDGLRDYLRGLLTDRDVLPPELFLGKSGQEGEAADWALCWLPSSDANAGVELVQESYVNLIPTAQGGTHVNGLRSGLTDALREFCDFRNLLPRGVKLAPEDVWDRLAFVLSSSCTDPQFSGQTKERLSSRQAAAFVEGAVHDAFSLWLNQHVDTGREDRPARDRTRLGAAQDREADRAQEDRAGPRPARQARRLQLAGSVAHRTVPGRRRFGRRQREAGARQGVPGHPSLRGKILNTWEVESSGVLASQEVHDLAVAIGCDPGKDNIDGLRYGKVVILADADSDGLHIATLLSALFCGISPRWCAKVICFVAMPPLFRVDVGKRCSTRWMRKRSACCWNGSSARKDQGPGQRHPLQGPGRDEPVPIARIHHPSRHAPTGSAHHRRC